MRINYNYLGDISEQFIVPYVFKDSVSTTADLLAIKAPLDGEIRKVSADGKFYQYDKENNTWNEKTIYAYDTNDNGIVDKAESIDDGAGNTATAADIKSTVDLKHSQNTDTGTSATEFNIDTGGDNVPVKAHIQSTSNPHSVTKDQVGLGNVPNLKDNLSATTAPTATDDSGAGYSVGSLWCDTTNDNVYICIDSSASAAIWRIVPVTADDISEGSTNKFFNGKTQDDLPDGATYKQYNPASVSITGGSISGITDLAVADGGTGTSDGSITGTGALTFAAGGTDKNVILTPSGAGYIILNGSVSIGTTSLASKLRVAAGNIELDNNRYFSVQDSAGSRRDLITLDSSNNLLLRNPAGNRYIILNGDVNGNVGINKTSPDYKLDVNGTFGFTPGSSVTPVDNGDVVIEATNDTTLTFKLKGSDGVIRSGTLALS